jgi:hypothetical protein
MILNQNLIISSLVIVDLAQTYQKMEEKKYITYTFYKSQHCSGCLEKAFYKYFDT